MRRNEGESEEIGNLILELNCKIKSIYFFPHCKMQFKTPTCIHSSEETFRRFMIPFFLPSQSHARTAYVHYLLALHAYLKTKIRKIKFVCFKKSLLNVLFSPFSFSLMKQPNIHTLLSAQL